MDGQRYSAWSDKAELRQKKSLKSSMHVGLVLVHSASQETGSISWQLTTGYCLCSLVFRASVCLYLPRGGSGVGVCVKQQETCRSPLNSWAVFLRGLGLKCYKGPLCACLAHKPASICQQQWEKALECRCASPEPVERQVLRVVVSAFLF